MCFSKGKSIVQKQCWKDARGLYLGMEEALEENKSLPSGTFTTLKTSGCTARQCQHQSWRPDLLAPLILLTKHRQFLERCRVILGVGISKGSLLRFLQHLPLCSCCPPPLLFLLWGFSLLGTSAWGSDHHRPTPGPSFMPGPFLFLSQESPTRSSEYFYIF